MKNTEQFGSSWPSHFPVLAALAQDARDREPVVGDPRLANPWEDFDDIYPVKPAIVFTVTETMRQADAAERAERERKRRAGITWTPPFVVEAAAPAEPKPQPIYVLPPNRGPRQRVPKRICASCPAVLARIAKRDLCHHCYEQKRTAMTLPAPVPILEALGASR